MQTRSYFYSPFSESEVCAEKTRSLLLQFILSELCISSTLSSPGLVKDFFKTPSPFQEASPLQKLKEHTYLLGFAFPSKAQETTLFSHALSNVCHILYNHSLLQGGEQYEEQFQERLFKYLKHMVFLLEPFMEECKNDTCLLFFLLSHHKEIVLLTSPMYFSSLLLRLHPRGVTSLQDCICDHLHKRGFAYLIPEIESLLEHALFYV